MTYVWKPAPPLPWCVTCGMHQVAEREYYTCPLCPPQRPCRTSLGVPVGDPISGQRVWQPSADTLARMHGGAA